MNDLNVNLPGWCSPEKRADLYNTIITTKPSLVVEIGVYGGASFIPMAMAAKEVGAKAIGIDPWRVDACLEGMMDAANIRWWTENSALEAVMEAAQNAIAELGLTNAVLLRNTSDNVYDQFADRSIGVLSIDGNHSYEPCRKDCEHYLPKVAPGGYIFMDDEGWTEQGVATVKPNIEWLCQQGCTYLRSVTGCAVLRKDNP